MMTMSSNGAISAAGVFGIIPDESVAACLSYLDDLRDVCAVESTCGALRDVLSRRCSSRLWLDAIRRRHPVLEEVLESMIPAAAAVTASGHVVENPSGESARQCGAPTVKALKGLLSQRIASDKRMARAGLEGAVDLKSTSVLYEANLDSYEFIVLAYRGGREVGEEISLPVTRGTLYDAGRNRGFIRLDFVGSLPRRSWSALRTLTRESTLEIYVAAAADHDCPGGQKQYALLCRGHGEKFVLPTIGVGKLPHIPFGANPTVFVGIVRGSTPDECFLGLDFGWYHSIGPKEQNDMELYDINFMLGRMLDFHEGPLDAAFQDRCWQSVQSANILRSELPPFASYGFIVDLEHSDIGRLSTYVVEGALLNEPGIMSLDIGGVISKEAIHRMENGDLIVNIHVVDRKTGKVGPFYRGITDFDGMCHEGEDANDWLQNLFFHGIDIYDHTSNSQLIQLLMSMSVVDDENIRMGIEYYCDSDQRCIPHLQGHFLHLCHVLTVGN